MITIHENLYTPKDLEEKGLMSLTTQWRERLAGRLRFYQRGRRIFYSDRHLEEFFHKCEVAKTPKSLRTANS